MKKIFTLFAALMMVFSMNAATKTIYCKMAQSWWKADGAAVGAYYWGTGAAPSWPGVRMTPVAGETDLWSIDIDTDKFQKIIFTRVNGSGTVSDWGAKTADLTVPTDDKNLYTITSTSPVWGDPGVAGTWSVYAPDAPKTYKDITITVVANATPKIHYWEGGDKVVGTEWDAKPDMVTTGEENTYSYTIKEVDEATGVKYLVVVGEVQSADQQAFEDVNKNFKELLPKVVVKGINNDWGDTNTMTVADDYKSASITLPLEAAKDYELKLTVNGEWFGSNAITITKDNNSASFAENGDGNGKLTTDLAGDYVFTYTYATKTLVVTYPAPAAEPEVELPAASVRAWAYDLALAVEGEQYTFSYKATTAAKATLIFTDAEGAELSTVDLGVVEAGANSKVLAASELPEVAEINWAIKLEAGAIAEVAEVTDQTRGIYDFYNMMDVLVDNNPESDYFGKIYIQMAYNGASDAATDRSAVQTAGLFIYDQALNELNDPSNVGIKPTLPEGYTMGDNRNRFHRLEIDPKTGKLAYCYNIAGSPAVFAMDRANLTGEVENLLAGVEGLNQTCALAFDEEGALYVMNIANSAGAVYKIVDGQAVAMTEATGKWVNASMTLAADGMGGVWVAQNRGQIDGYYQLAHVTKDGVLDYTVFNGSNPDNLTGSSTRGALVYDAERQLLAQGRNGKVEVYSVAYNAETGVPSLTLVATTPTVGTNIDGLAFDYAGDLYVVNSSKEKFQKFAMPTADNVCTTPASSKYAIELGSEDSEYALEETVEISNLTTETLTVGEATYLQLSGRNDMLDCDVQLFLNNYTGADGDYDVNVENSLMTFGGLELTVVEGKLAQTTDAEKGAVYTGRVIASVEDEGEVMLIALDLIMYSTPAIEVTIEDAVARVDEETGALVLNAEWTYEGVTYPVFVSVAGYEDVEFKEYEGAQISEIQIGSDEEENSPWLDFAVANAVAVIKEGSVITVEGEYTSWATGTTYVVTANGVMQSGNADPEYEVYEDAITNLVIDYDNMLLTGGPSEALQVEVVLGLGDYDRNTDNFALLPESSVAIRGIDATFVEGYASVDGVAQTANAVVRCVWSEMNIELHLAMSAATIEPTVVVVENAVVEVDSFIIYGDTYDYALKMTGNWVNEEDGVTYPVLVEVPVYYPGSTEPFEMMSTVTVGGWGDDDPWLGFGEGYLTITPEGDKITATGIVQNPQASVAIDITISGKLSGEDPGTALENATVVVKTVKMIKNGQLIINKGDVEYNAQGTILK